MMEWLGILEVAIKLAMLVAAITLGWFGPTLLDAMQRQRIH